MAQHLRYIQQRDNGIYYYNRRIPQFVMSDDAAFARLFNRQKLFRRSLGTRAQAHAMKRGAEVHEAFERALREVEGHPGRDELPETISDNATRPITRELLAKITADACDRVVRPWVRRTVLAEHGQDYHDQLEGLAQQRELNADSIRAVLKEREERDDPALPNIRQLARDLVNHERLDAPDGSDELALVARAIRDGLIQGETTVDAMLAGKMPALPSRSQAPPAPRLSEIVEDYCAHVGTPRTKREINGALKSFVASIGDLPLDEITRTHFLTFCKTEGAKTVGGKARGSVARPMSPETLQKKVRLLHAAIDRARKIGDFEGSNPASKIDVRPFAKPVPKATMPQKRPFDVHEINLILRYPWFTGCLSPSRPHEPGNHRLDGMHFWAPLMALYTGCRAGELGGLLISEVRLDHQYPHVVIRDNEHRRTKGGYSRNVPLLDAFLALGFEHYVERLQSAGAKRLFPDWKPPRARATVDYPTWSNAQLLRSFNRTVVPTALRGILSPEARNEVTFHSFRGAFKTLLGRAEYGVPVNYIHEIVGHAKSNLDQRYVGEIPIEDTYQTVRHCDYRGIMLPAPPTSIEGRFSPSQVPPIPLS